MNTRQAERFKQFNMDRIAEVIAKHGNVWSLTTNSDMIEVFEPLQAEMAASFKDTVKSVKAQKYGPDERQRADVGNLLHFI